MDSMASMARGRLMLLCLLDTPRCSPHPPPSSTTPLSSLWSTMLLLSPLWVMLVWVTLVLATTVLATDFPTPSSRGMLIPQSSLDVPPSSAHPPLSSTTPLSSLSSTTPLWSMPPLLQLWVTLVWVTLVLATMVLATDSPMPLSRGTLRLTLLWFLVPSPTPPPLWLTPLPSMLLPPLVLWLTTPLSSPSSRPPLRSAMRSLPTTFPSPSATTDTVDTPTSDKLLILRRSQPDLP